MLELWPVLLNTYSQPRKSTPSPIEGHPYLARIKVCEQNSMLQVISIHRHPRYTVTLDISPPSIYRHKFRWTKRVGTLSVPLRVFRETVGVPVVVLLLQFCSTVVCSNAPSYWTCFDTNENVFCEVAIWVLYFFVLNACITPEYVSRKKKD